VRGDYLEGHTTFGEMAFDLHAVCSRFLTKLRLSPFAQRVVRALCGNPDSSGLKEKVRLAARGAGLFRDKRFCTSEEARKRNNNGCIYWSGSQGTLALLSHRREQALTMRGATAEVPRCLPSVFRAGSNRCRQGRPCDLNVLPLQYNCNEAYRAPNNDLCCRRTSSRGRARSNRHLITLEGLASRCPPVLWAIYAAHAKATGAVVAALIE
jgi:hypothetical protein